MGTTLDSCHVDVLSAFGVSADDLVAATAAVGKHPTEMHSCSLSIYLLHLKTFPIGRVIPGSSSSSPSSSK